MGRDEHEQDLLERLRQVTERFDKLLFGVADSFVTERGQYGG